MEYLTKYDATHGNWIEFVDDDGSFTEIRHVDCTCDWEHGCGCDAGYGDWEYAHDDDDQPIYVIQKRCTYDEHFAAMGWAVDEYGLPIIEPEDEEDA